VIERYGIYWVNLDPTEGRETSKTRLCVTISPKAMHAAGLAVVCPLTTKLHRTWAHRMQVRCKGKDAEIMPDQIRTVSIARFGRRIATLNASDAQDLRSLIVRLYGTL
jgi:mRNA interferase MazF